MIALMMEAASTYETSVNFCQTTRRNNPEDSRLQQTNKYGATTSGMEETFTNDFP
jgi:hypothetical protein